MFQAAPLMIKTISLSTASTQNNLDRCQFNFGDGLYSGEECYSI